MKTHMSTGKAQKKRSLKLLSTTQPAINASRQLKSVASDPAGVSLCSGFSVSFRRIKNNLLNV